MDENLTKAASDITGIIAKLAGPLADEAGQILGDKAREYRLRNAIKIFKRVQQMLRDAGIAPQQIAPRLFLPALEAASIEDNETLQEKWAALLANASDPKQMSPVLPSFVEILKELTPDEAQFMRLILERAKTHVRPASWVHPSPIERGIPLGVFNDLRLLWRVSENNEDFHIQQISLMVDDLVRLGLLDRLPWYPPADLQIVWSKELDRQFPGDSDYFLPPFAIAFMEACTAPHQEAQSMRASNK